MKVNRLFGRVLWRSGRTTSAADCPQQHGIRTCRKANACGLNLGRKTHFPSFTVRILIFYINVDLSFENVKEFVLTRVHMLRRFISGCQSCLH